MSPKPGRSPELPPPQQGISLHELTEAFAQAMGHREPTEPAPAREAEPNADSPPAAESPPSAEQALLEPTAQDPAGQDLVEPAGEDAGDDACPLSPQAIVEAMLFVGNRDNEPLTARQAADLMRGVAPGEIVDLVAGLNRRYEANGCPYQIVSDGPGYRLTLRKNYEAVRRQFYGRVRETRLSQAAVDILAIVAYQQPISAEQVSQLRGRPSSRALSQLVRRGLLRIERPDPQSRVPHYCTASRFLELFGLQNLQDLPQSEDLG
jgi:segregation and condensation protein B